MSTTDLVVVCFGESADCTGVGVQYHGPDVGWLCEWCAEALDEPADDPKESR